MVPIILVYLWVRRRGAGQQTYNMMEAAIQTRPYGGPDFTAL